MFKSWIILNPHNLSFPQTSLLPKNGKRVLALTNKSYSYLFDKIG